MLVEKGLGFILACTSSMYGERDDELPHEVILAIKRILNLQQGQNDDPLDSLSNEFSPVDLLNSYFPDGILYKYLQLSTSSSLCRSITGPDGSRPSSSRSK